MGFTGDEEDGEVRRLQGLQRGRLAPVDHQGHTGVVGRAREALEGWEAAGGDRWRARVGDGG
jgi:hypothetical protein